MRTAHWRVGSNLLAAMLIMTLVPACGALLIRGNLGSVGQAHAAQHTSRKGGYSFRNPEPITKAYPVSRQGVIPPAQPSGNILPSPNFLQICDDARYDDSSTCVNATVEAIDNARTTEGLAGLVLPGDWYWLTPEEQMLVATNLERTVRGLAPLQGLAIALQPSSEAAAADSSDPSPPGGFPFLSWGGNWAGGLGNPLEAMYLWMYDDGVGSPNVECTAPGQPGCWGHRDNVLAPMNCQPCVMGAGFDSTGWQGVPAWSELLVDTWGNPPLAFGWSEVLPSLPGSPGGAGLLAPAVDIATTRDRGGYWLASADGGVFAFGDAGFYNSMAGIPLSAPVVTIAATPDGGGYWLAASDGGIFSFGDARFYGSMGGHHLNQPVVGMTPTPDGLGYWLVASDGGIFSFGDARFYGSMGGRQLNQPVVGMAATPDGHGYWLVASDGGIFAFGDAGFHGSMGGHHLNQPVVGMTATPDGLGYWLVASDGGIFSFGDAPFRGSTGSERLVAPVVGMTSPSGSGYWLIAADGGVFSFNVPFRGSMG
ncbi:MAG TPA: hypothetical protein VEJ87_12010 [Acidimicrobiales bacterium]|nr:hypothetical protein [Acidimicrobiales bacterium]